MRITLLFAWERSCGGVAFSKAQTLKCLNWSGLTAGMAGYPSFVVFMNKFAPTCFMVTGRLNYQHKHQRVKINHRERE